MKIVIFILLISFNSLAQSPEKLLESILRPEEACSTTNHCENFHQASCEDRDFAYDGTSSVRNQGEWDQKVQKVKEKVRGPFAKEIKASYDKLNDEEWKEFVESLNLEACEKSKCADRISEHHADQMIKASISPRVKTSIFDSDFVPQGKDFVKILGINPAYEKVKAEILETIRFKEDEDKMLSMVSGIKDAIKAKITEMIPDENKRKELFANLDKTSFKGFECADNDLLQSYFMTGAFNTKMEDGKKVITYCGGNFRENGSSFNLAYLLAHEFTHSIDPCNFRPKDISKVERSFLESQHPFSNVIACLRSPDSVGADWSEDFYKQNVPSQTLCVEDQIGESFSDWMAAEVVPDFIAKRYPKLSTENYKQGFMNISRTLKCNEAIKHTGRVEEHPRPEARINNLMMANRKIRKAVGCGEIETAKVQCDGKNDISTLRAPASKKKSGPLPDFKL